MIETDTSVNTENQVGSEIDLDPGNQDHSRIIVIKDWLQDIDSELREAGHDPDAAMATLMAALEIKKEKAAQERKEAVKNAKSPFQGLIEQLGKVVNENPELEDQVDTVIYLIKNWEQRLSDNLKQHLYLARSKREDEDRVKRNFVRELYQNNRKNTLFSGIDLESAEKIMKAILREDFDINNTNHDKQMFSDQVTGMAFGTSAPSGEPGGEKVNIYFSFIRLSNLPHIRDALLDSLLSQ